MQALERKENTMPPTRLALVYVVTVPVFFAIDLVWLGVIARSF